MSWVCYLIIYLIICSFMLWYIIMDIVGSGKDVVLGEVLVCTFLSYCPLINLIVMKEILGEMVDKLLETKVLDKVIFKGKGH